MNNEFRERKEVRYYGRSYSIPSELPLRHPILQELVGEFALPKVIPTWWGTGIKSLPFYRALMMSTVTTEQFYDGNVDEKYVKSMRATMSTEDKKTVPQSTSIAKWLDESTLLNKFNNRGAIGVGVVAKITANPFDHFYMSNGNGWSSCQRWSGSYANRLMGTVCDPYAAMAIITPQDAAINATTEEDGGTLLARCILRLMFVGNMPVVAVDRVYGQDDGTIKSFARQIGEYLESRECLVGYGKIGRAHV